MGEFDNPKVGASRIAEGVKERAVKDTRRDGCRGQGEVANTHRLEIGGRSGTGSHIAESRLRRPGGRTATLSTDSGDLERVAPVMKRMG